METLKSPAGTRLVHTALAMNGFRFDRPWTLLLGGAAYGYGLLLRAGDCAGASIGYFAGAWLLYYVGNALVLRRRGGTEESFARYEIALAFAFTNLAVSLATLSVLPGSISAVLPAGAVFAAGVLLFAIGLTVKLWAAMLIGVEAYYYRDLFLRTRATEFVTRGPYRWMANPMYGLGYGMAYGLAFLHDSLPMLAGAALLHAGAWAFHFLVESPFVRAVYR